VLLVQKWDDLTSCPSPSGEGRRGLCPRCDDYPIFFATMQEPSKDNSGEKIYLRKRDCHLTRGHAPLLVSDPTVEYITNPKNLDEYAFDQHDHLIVKHDLFNHEGFTRDGIAEAFAEFARKEKLSFF
jgi:type I restriction enzyme M protein